VLSVTYCRQNAEVHYITNLTENSDASFSAVCRCGLPLRFVVCRTSQNNKNNSTYQMKASDVNSKLAIKLLSLINKHTNN
jgi:hypothetical protein